MTQTTDQDRAEFEAWLISYWTAENHWQCDFQELKKILHGSRLRWSKRLGKYLANDAQARWEAWQAARRVQVVPQVEVTDCMVLAFHNAVTDGPIGEDDFNDIKTGLHAALAAAPEKPKFDASKLQKLLERLQLVTDEGPPDEGWKSTALEEGIAELERMLAAAPQPPEGLIQENPATKPEAAAEHQALRSVYEAARGLLRHEGVDDGRAIAYREKLASAIEEVKHIDGGLWEPQDSLMSENRTSKTVAAPVQMPEPVAFALEWTFNGEERGMRLYDDETHCRFDAESDGGVCHPLYTEHQVSQLLAAAPQPQEAASVQMPEPISKALEDCRSRAIDYATCPSPYNNTRMETAFQHLEHQVRQLHAAKVVKEKVQVHEPANCWCQACDIATSQYGFRTRMSLCPKCGDKRCPRAQHHGFQCQSEKKD